MEIMEEELVEKKGSMHKLIVIGQAVEFLQALLDMMTEQHIHLEVSLTLLTAMPSDTTDSHAL